MDKSQLSTFSQKQLRPALDLLSAASLSARTALQAWNDLNAAAEITSAPDLIDDGSAGARLLPMTGADFHAAIALLELVVPSGGTLPALALTDRAAAPAAKASDVVAAIATAQADAVALPADVAIP